MGAHRLAIVVTANELPEEPVPGPRHNAHELPAAERVENFAEAVVGISAEEALEEAARCLRCDIRDHHH